MTSLFSAIKLAVLLSFGWSFCATARDDAWQQREDNSAWRSECSACHIAFPPALLAADDWGKIMLRLDKHYGAEASLDATTRDGIAAYLARNAGGGSHSSAAGSDSELPRITSSDWFLRKHGSAIRLWRKGKVKSLADCAACHKGPDIEKMQGG
jgi:hypothetical protein